MNITALKDLIAKVEANGITSRFDPLFEKALYTAASDMTLLVYPAGQAAVERDVNAALALKDELLGDRWCVALYQDNGGEWCVEFGKVAFDSNPKHAAHKTLATAILLATLKAKLFELEAEE